MTCKNAASSGNLEVLQWLRGQVPPCPWEADTVFHAGMMGHVDVLKWIFERKNEISCTWETVQLFAQSHGHHLEAVYQWLKERNPEKVVESLALLGAVVHKRKPVVKWLSAVLLPDVFV